MTTNIDEDMQPSSPRGSRGTPTDARRGRSSGALDQFVLGMIGPVFLALAAWMILAPREVPIPHRDAVHVPASSVSAEPLRHPNTGPPTIKAGGYDLRCMECHKLFSTADRARRPLMRHQEIVLDHGLNDRCLNCHDADRRDLLFLPDGSTLTFDQAPFLCAACHGPAYRDWERGIHGRAVGYWDARRAGRRHLTCSECHDPHAPAYKPMALLPGPNTLRLETTAGRPSAHEGAQRNPLRKWSEPSGTHADDGRDREAAPDRRKQ